MHYNRRAFDVAGTIPNTSTTKGSLSECIAIEELLMLLVLSPTPSMTEESLEANVDEGTG